MRFLITALVLGFFVAGGIARALSTGLDRTFSGDDVTVTMTSPFEDLPPGGCLPYRVTVRNDAGSAGTWLFGAQASCNSSAGAVVFKQSMTVPADSSASFDVAIPLPIFRGMGQTEIFFTMTGPGFSKTYRPFLAYIFSSVPHSEQPFAVIGDQILGPSGLSLLDPSRKGPGIDFYASGAEAEKLPVDWRNYAGVGALLLRDSEWQGLDPRQREAVCGYAAQGGHLTLFTSDPNGSLTPELHLPTSDGLPGSYGFGTISLLPVSSFPPDVETIKAAVNDHPAPSAASVDQGFGRWSLRKTFGTIAAGGTFILLFVLVFAGVVGPLNLFVFARGPQRFRLFWTTPLISLAATAALILGILLTDGIGGKGRRFVACFSLPDAQREAVIQEQVARTAVLFANHWRNNQNYLITPVSAHALNNAEAPNGYRVYTAVDASDSTESYLQQDGDYSGAWFRSRSISGQYLEDVRPSRSVLTVLNAGALRSRGEAPVVVSSYPQQLDRVFLLDSAGHYWSCDHLDPGRRQICTSSTEDDYNRFWTLAEADAGGKLRPLLDRARGRAGCFYATGLAPADEQLATLEEIHWQPAQGVYLGSWVADSGGENP